MDAAGQTEAQSLIDATYRVITSSDFAENLLSIQELFGDLWLGPGGGQIATSSALALYLNQDATYPMLPSTVQWAGNGDNVKGETGIVNGGRAGHIVLDSETRNRWASTAPITRSCAINTLAHEMTHVVALHPKEDGGQIFVDSGRWWATRLHRPLASYVVGAVAQCTFISSNHDKSALRACVTRRGINILEAEACM